MENNFISKTNSDIAIPLSNNTLNNITENNEEISTKNVIQEEKDNIIMSQEQTNTIDNNNSASVTLENNNVDVISPTRYDNEKKSFFNSLFTTKQEKFSFIFFMIPIIIMSFVSMLHLVDFFEIGANTVVAWLLAFAFETASLATILAIVLLKRMNKIYLWAVWFLLFCLQIVGNVYSPFSIINPEQAQRLFDFFALNPSVIASQRIIAVIHGGILPTATFFLFKIASDYLKINKQ